MGGVFSSSVTKPRQDYYFVSYSDDIHSYECIVAKFIPIIGINITPTKIELVEDTRKLDDIQENEIVLGIMLYKNRTEFVKITSDDLVTSSIEADDIVKAIANGESVPAYIEKIDISC
jgi:hypothetical protein